MRSVVEREMTQAQKWNHQSVQACGTEIELAIPEPIAFWNGYKVTKPFEWSGDETMRGFVESGTRVNEMTAWWHSDSRGV